jgi:hypothetical protein
MIEFVKCFFYVSGHENVDGAVGVIPGESEATV